MSLFDFVRHPTGLRPKPTALCLAIALALSGQAMAQETTSAILGKVTAPDGSPAANTKIIIVHKPSGTSSEVRTNAEGTFSVKGLRVGGPYTVTIDSDTYRDAQMRNLYLQLGKTLRLDQQLQSEAMEEVVVLGTKTSSSTTGANSVFSAEDIKNAPAFNRDLKDIVRNNPMVVVDEDGNLSIGGANPRYNSITVDGMGQNDDFGLNYGGYPTQRPPISLDAVSQISVDSAPFTAKVGGFSGGLVNVVTKSGTNALQGSAFYETMNKSFAGKPKAADGSEGGDLGEDSSMGFSLGGPLVQDKAFYFVSYEKSASSQSQLYGVNGQGANASNIGSADYNRFLQILQDTYGTSDSQAGGLDENDEKILLKLDWNLSDSQRLDFSYQGQVNEDGRNSSDQDYQLRMASNAYTLKTTSDTFSTHLFSDWSDAFSTELGISYKDLNTRSLTHSNLGQVTVSVGKDEIVFGSDRYRHANDADTKTFKFNLDADYLLGNQDIKFGYQGERLRLYNLFGDSTKGVWEFDSLDDFANKAPSYFAYKNAYTNKVADLAYAQVRFTHALYVEDTWAARPDLTLTFGLRYERLQSDDKPQENANFVATYGYTNTNNLDGLDILLPRFNLTWDITERSTLRAGLGRFSGGKPNVWIANSFTNDGMTLVSAPSSATNAARQDPANVDFSRIPDAVSASLKAGTGSVNYVDPNYKLESNWRFQLGWDQQLDIPYLGDDYQWSLEFNYVKDQDSSFWKDTSRVVAGTTADGGRNIYKSIYTGSLANNYDLMLTNAEKSGRSIIWTTNLRKDWDNGVHLNTAYTHQDITDVNPGTSSTASSNYQYNVAINRNDELLGTAYYQVKHRLVLNLGYTAQWFGDNDTKFNLYVERRSGRPFSWTMGAYNDNDLGDQRDFSNSDVYLPYIPTGADDANVDWAKSDWPNATTAAEKYAQMQALINAAGLESYAGGYAPKYSAYQPWVTDMDLSIQQELPGFAAGHKATIYLTINNLLNLIDKDKGQVRRMEYPQQILWDYDVNATTGQYQIDQRFGGSNTKNWSEYIPELSTWRLKLGVRYDF